MCELLGNFLNEYDSDIAKEMEKLLHYELVDLVEQKN